MPAIVLMVIGLAIRLHGVNRGLWEDEITVAFYTQLPISDVAGTLAQNGAHPPLYFLVARLGARAGLDIVPSLRVPSVVAGTATIGVVYFIALKLIGRIGAVVAGLVAMIAPLAVWYSQEGRMYALVWFFVLGSYLFLVWGHDSRAWGLFAALHGLFVGLALWTDYSAALALAFQPILILLLKRRPWFFSSWAAGWISIVPWLFFLGQQYGRIQAQRFPGLGMDLRSWLSVLADLTSASASFASDPNPLPDVAAATLLILIAAAAGTTIWAAFHGRARIAFLVAALTIGPLVVAAALALHGTVAVVIPRVMGMVGFGIAFMLGAAAAAAVGLQWRPAPAVGAVAVAAVLVLVGASEVDVAQNGSNGTSWDTIGDTINSNARQGDELIYYPIATKYAVDPFLDPSSPFRTDFNGMWPMTDDVAQQTFALWVAGKPRVWFVYLAITGVDMPQNDLWFTQHNLCRVMGDPDGGSGLIEYEASTTHC